MKLFFPYNGKEFCISLSTKRLILHILFHIIFSFKTLKQQKESLQNLLQFSGLKVCKSTYLKINYNVTHIFMFLNGKVYSAKVKLEKSVFFKTAGK